jgi:hypothetical protein
MTRIRGGVIGKRNGLIQHLCGKSGENKYGGVEDPL